MTLTHTLVGQFSLTVKGSKDKLTGGAVVLPTARAHEMLGA